MSRSDMLSGWCWGKRRSEVEREKGDDDERRGFFSEVKIGGPDRGREVIR